jgi:two-component system response regulator TctD
MHLLLVEDDTALRTALQRSLERTGMRVNACADGVQALQQWQQRTPDVVVLDLSLPQLDGLQVLHRARQAGLRTPVLLLTARGTVGDKVLGLNAGADDYLPKPFDLDELEARLRALHRRHHNGQNEGPAHGQLGPFRVDPPSGAVLRQGQVFELPQRELALLRALLARPGQALTKEQLFAQVFPGESEVQYDAIEVVVYRLRKKLQGSGVTLMTLRGLGYLLKLETACGA